jgi:hypothetical protein
MITGPGGFLYNELNMEDSDDLLFLLGSPTHNDKIKLDEYVSSTKNLVQNNLDKYIVFASTAYIEHSDDDYNKSKRELELFIEQNCVNYLILKIGDIISKDLTKVKKMKLNRTQQQILQNDLTDISIKGSYLDLEQFVKETKEIITNKKTGIHHFNLIELSLTDLIRYAN